MRNAILALVLLGIGAGGGFAAAWWIYAGRSAQSANAGHALETLVEPVDTAADSGRAMASAAIVRLELERPDGLRRAHAVWVRAGTPPEGAVVLVTSLDAVKGATAGHVAGSARRRLPLGAVVAANLQHGLVALSAPDGHPGLRLATESGSLYLGREFKFRNGAGWLTGYIDSPASEGPTGGFRYLARTEGLVTGPGVALLDRGTDTLLGLGVAGDADAYGFEAVDAAAIADLLDELPRSEQLSLAQFSERYFSTTEPGRLERLLGLLQARRWQAAISLGEPMLGADWRNRDAIRDSLDLAYQQRAREQREAGEPALALVTLARADEQLGPSAARLAARGQAELAMGRLGEARSSLRAALQREPSRALEILPTLRRLTLAYANDSSTPVGAALAALAAELEVDPEYAAYHETQGRLYYAQGDYAAAYSAWQRAVALDATAAQRLGRQMQQAKQRLATPERIELPIDVSGGAIFVRVNLNGSADTFRFLLDTGATYTAITTATALRLGIRNLLIGAPAIELNTASGLIYAQSVTLDSIGVGSAVVRSVPVVVLETMNGTDGLLGLSFLNHFNVDIDRDANKLVLNRR